MTKIKVDIKKELEKRVLVLDGAMGTMIQRFKLKKTIFVVNVLLNTLVI